MKSIRIPCGRRALVLGAGASGKVCAVHLYERGWDVVLTDTREHPPVEESALTGMQCVFGQMPESLVDDVDLVVMSPGLSPQFSDAKDIVAAARAQGIEVIGEIELFARELARLKKFRGYAPVVIGITGTNGKTTTTTMVGLMVEANHQSVCVAGNIGPNALAELDRLNEAAQLPDVWVLELSSFQLETTSSLKCSAAAFLNLTEDHVDWHGSIEAYGEAKARIFSESTVRILNRDDIATLRFSKGNAQTFGDGDPQNPGEWGITQEAGLEWLSRIPTAPLAGTTKKAQLAAEPVQKALLMPVEALRIQGRHNAMNALAALALIEAAGLGLAGALQVLKTYQGEAHRVQSVLSVNGIEFIDDSKGTNVGAVIAALTGLGKSGRKSSLVMGGDGKGQDFSPLANSVKHHARYVALIGRDADLIASALKDTGVVAEKFGTDFEAAVRAAYGAAQTGDTVLLSPACASWDMFKSYAERSALFVDIARRIAEEFETLHVTQTDSDNPI